MFLITADIYHIIKNKEYAIHFYYSDLLLLPKIYCDRQWSVISRN